MRMQYLAHPHQRDVDGFQLASHTFVIRIKSRQSRERTIYRCDHLRPPSVRRGKPLDSTQRTGMAPRVAAANVCFDASPPENVRARAAVLHLHGVLTLVLVLTRYGLRAICGRLSEGSVAYAALAVTWSVVWKRCERDRHSVGGEEMSDLVV